MILLNAGIPFIFVEIPMLLLSLVIVITAEYYVLTKTGIKFSSVVWSNVLSTIIGVPLSNIARGYLSSFSDDRSVVTNPFEASLGIGDYSYQGGFIVVLLIIVFFDFIFSLLVEFVFYRLKYKSLPAKQLFVKTMLANIYSYLLLLIIFFTWSLL